MSLLKQTVLCGLASTWFIACGGSNEEAQAPAQQPYPPQQQGAYPQQQQPPAQGYPQQQPPAQGYPQQQPPAQGYPQQQQPAQPPPVAGAAAIPGFSMPGMAPPPAGQAQAVDASVAASAQTIVNTLAATEAPAGAKPLGSLVAGNFGTGGALESQFQMQPGKCYTVVGAGLPNVTELNLQFAYITPMGTATPAFAQDQSTGPQAVLGPKPNCYKHALVMPVPVKMIMTVSAGSGLAGAQIYEK